MVKIRAKRTPGWSLLNAFWTELIPQGPMIYQSTLKLGHKLLLMCNLLMSKLKGRCLVVIKIQEGHIYKNCLSKSTHFCIYFDIFFCLRREVKFWRYSSWAEFIQEGDMGSRRHAVSMAQSLNSIWPAEVPFGVQKKNGFASTTAPDRSWHRIVQK